MYVIKIYEDNNIYAGKVLKTFIKYGRKYYLIRVIYQRGYNTKYKQIWIKEENEGEILEFISLEDFMEGLRLKLL